MPIYHRHTNTLVFMLGGSDINPLDKEPDAVAVLWLRDLPDNDEQQCVQRLAFSTYADSFWTEFAFRS